MAKFTTKKDKIFQAVSKTEKEDTDPVGSYAVEVTPDRIWIKQGGTDEVCVTPRVFNLISAFLIKNGVVW